MPAARPILPPLVVCLCCCIGWLHLPARGQTPPPLPEPREIRPRGMELAASKALSAARPPRRLALCIGINGYRTPDYRPLALAASDATALGKSLASAGYDVTVMTDEAADPLKPTQANIESQLAQLIARGDQPDDTMIVTFAGHGDVIAAAAAALLPLDYGAGGREIKLQSILDQLCSPAVQARRKMLILDACRSSLDGVQRRQKQAFVQALVDPQSLVVLSGCGVSQSSYEDPDLGHGRLTAALLDGLAGQAFAKDQEFLLADQWCAYVQRVFRDKGWSDRQSPEKYEKSTAHVRFDIARRDVPRPPPLSKFDQDLLNLSIERWRIACNDGDYVQAIEAAGAGLRFKDSDADLLGLRALAYLFAGYKDKARDEADQALRRNAGQPAALHVRGMLTLLAGENEQSLKLLMQATLAVDADPRRWPVLASGRAAASRLLTAAYTCGRSGRSRDELDLYTRAIEMKDTPAKLVAVALVGRGVCHGKQGQADKEIADYNRVIEMKDAPAELVAQALFNRGVRHGQQGQADKGIADYTRVIGMKNAPAEQVAKALVNRGIRHGKQNRSEKTVTDYSRVIQMKDAPAELVAEALVNRGIRHGKLGQADKEIADFTRVIEMKDAPAEQVAIALVNRGCCHYVSTRLEQALADWRRAMELDPANATAAYNLAVLLVRQGQFPAACDACRAALKLAKPTDGVLDDLIELRDKLKGPPETAVFLGWMRLEAGQADQAKADLRGYLDRHASGPIAGLARQLLANAATRPAATQPSSK